MRGLSFASLALALVLTACNGSEPLASQYKKELTGGAGADAAPDSGSDGNQSGGGGGADPAAAGKTFFTSAGCKSCHGADGKGPTKITPVAAPFDKTGFADAKSQSSAHESGWPKTDADAANVIAFLNSVK